jgi:ABC-type sulfate/molybdate transport systems ATPase subunit
MSGGQHKGIAFSRTTHWANKLILLDEPTAALGVAETASDDFRAGFKVAKWRMFCHQERL